MRINFVSLNELARLHEHWCSSKTQHTTTACHRTRRTRPLSRHSSCQIASTCAGYWSISSRSHIARYRSSRIWHRSHHLRYASISSRWRERSQETCAGSRRFIDGIIVHKNISDSFFINLQIINICLFRQSSAFEQPCSLIIRILFQQGCANIYALVPLLPIKLACSKEKLIHIFIYIFWIHF